MNTSDDAWDACEARIRKTLDELQPAFEKVQADLAEFREAFHKLEIRLAVADALVRQARERHPSTVESGEGLCLSRYGDETCVLPLGHTETHHESTESVWRDLSEPGRCASKSEGVQCFRPVGHLGLHWDHPRGNKWTGTP